MSLCHCSSIAFVNDAKVCIIGIQMYALIPLLVVEVLSYVSTKATAIAKPGLLTSLPALLDTALLVSLAHGPFRWPGLTPAAAASRHANIDRYRYHYAVDAGRQDLPDYVQRGASLVMLHDLQD